MPRKTNININGSDYFRVTATIGKNPDGKPIRKQFYGSSKKEAEAKRDEYISSINKGLSANFDKAVFSHVFKTWFDNVLKPTVTMSTYERYEYKYRIRIKESVLSGMKLTEIKSINMQGYYNGLLEKYSVNTVHSTHKLLTSFFNYCVKADLIIKSPLIAVELPRIKPDKREFEVLSQQDIPKLIEVANTNKDYFLYMFAAFTGLRQGELLALTHNDIDFKENVIHVNKSVKYIMVDGVYKAVVSATKTPSSVRDVPILEPLKEPLKRHMRPDSNIIQFNTSNILFASETGTYREASNVRKGWARAIKRLKINDIQFHGLRHTFCTLLAVMGVPLKTASILMGHSDISVTAKIYTHVDNQELKKGIEKLAVFFNTF